MVWEAGGLNSIFPIILFNGHHDDSVVCPHLAFSQSAAAQKGIFAYPDLLQTQMHVLTVGGKFQKLHDCRPNGCLQHPSAGGLIGRDDLIRSSVFESGLDLILEGPGDNPSRRGSVLWR